MIKDENKNHIDDRLEHIVEVLQKRRDNAFVRYPFAFGVIITFGLVATFYGMEKIIDSIPFLQDKPWMVFLVGISTLAISGALYRKLN